MAKRRSVRPDAGTSVAPRLWAVIPRIGALIAVPAVVAMFVMSGIGSIPTTPSIPTMPAASGLWHPLFPVGGVVFEPLPIPEGSADEAKRAAETVLAQSEFKRPPKTWIEQAQTWLADNVSRVLQRLFEGGAGTMAAWLVLFVVVGLLGYFVSKLVRTVQADPGVRMLATVEARMSAGEWREAAERHERDGDWKEAIRCRFRALVGDLVDRGVLREVPGRTAGEYRRELRGSAPVAAPAFSEAAQLFEAAWYGDAPTGPAENEAFRQLAARTVAGVGR